MTRSQAERALNDIQKLLGDVYRFEKLSESSQRMLKLHAHRHKGEIDDIVRLLKKLERDAQPKAID
jgi:hypothetical protein